MAKRPQQRRPGVPGGAELTKSRAMRAYQQGDLSTAFQLASQAAEKLPRDADLMHCIGACLSRLGDPAGGIEKLERAAALRPRDPGILMSIAQTHRALQRFDDMDAAIDRALKLQPGFPDAVYLRAQSLRDRGMYDDAHAVLSPPIEGGTDNPTLLIGHAELCEAMRRPEEALASLERALATPTLRENAVRACLFLKGKLLDQLGRYDEAFAAFSQANAMLPASEPTSTADRVRTRWSAERLASVPRSSETTGLPLLVIGMPRSGTTLVEQMLAAHPLVESIGECHTLPALERAHNPANLDQATVDELAGTYLAELRAEAKPETRYVIDKLPGNYLQLGFASRVLPGVRAIFLDRDPRDTCLSCYFQNFGQSHTYSRDLKTCARAYAHHLEIMAHWREVLDTPILDMPYPDLVADPEGSVRRMLDFLGLEFDEACLRFHESKRSVTTLSSAQVRRPVYKSSLARWRNYETHIGPLVEELRTQGVSLPDA